MENISGEGKTIDTEILTQMWEIRSKDFENCNILENNFVYQICKDSYESAISGKTMVNDQNSHHALRKMAGIGLYLKQQQRDNSQINYDNPQELLELLKCSNSLKVLHPDLYNKYGFQTNIEILCKLQLNHNLPKEFEEKLKSAQETLINGSSKNDSNQSHNIQDGSDIQID